MFIKANSTTELFSLIEKDIKTNIPNAVRYPVRLIFVHKKETFRVVVKFLSNFSEIMEINKLLNNEDKWLTPDSLKQIIAGINKVTTFLPFGEFLRFCDSITFSSLLNSIFEIENNKSNRRIYLPVLGLKDEFLKNFLDHFHRREALIPIWEIDESNDKKTVIFQLKNDLQTKRSIIPTTSEWMNIWKQESNYQIISNSKVLEYLYEKYLPDPIYQMIPISNYQEMLSKIHHFEVPFEYIEREKEFWELLNKEIEKKDLISCSNFDDFTATHFNIKVIDFNEKQILKLWFESKTNFSRWILKQQFLLKNTNESYLTLILNKLLNLSDRNLLQVLWITPYLLDIDIEMLKQRKNILNYIHKDLQISYQFIENEISNYLSNHTIQNSNKIITDITFTERKHLLRNFKQKLQNEPNINFLKSQYSDIFYYLNWKNIETNSIQSWIKEYFQEYCLSKIINSKTEKLNSILSEKNKDSSSFYEWYFNLKLSKVSEKCKTIWFDGIGAEWFPFILYYLNTICKDSNYAVSSYNFVRVNLPSTTANNRFENVEHILEFDRFNHSEQSYKYPDNLIKQLDLIKNILRKIVNIISAEKIQIVSDHGFTFLCRKEFGNFKTLDFQNDDHEGRCMLTEENIKSDNDFLVHKIENGDLKGKQALVALRHKSLNKIPAREVHGGATPEEIIVPFIELVNVNTDIEYFHKIKNKMINIKNPILEISINPKPRSIPKLEIDGKTFSFKKSKNGLWVLRLSELAANNYFCNLIIDNKQYKFEFNLIGGMIENDLF